MIKNIMFILDGLFLAYLTIFVIYLIFWLVISVLASGKIKKGGLDNPYNRFAIIIPAHNEELLIGQLIDSGHSLDYHKKNYDIFVIADNCNDSTEKIAFDKKVKCYKRADLSKPGKPFALNWFFQQINIREYDAYVIIDADTLIEKNFLKAMNRKMNEGASIVQGYFGIMNPNETWLTRLMVIPGVLKYLYRFRGKAAMEFSAPLMGNGMCFSQEIILKYGWDALSLTENWEYYLKSCLRGHYAMYTDAYIYSQTASTVQQGKTQRERWFKGKLYCVINYLPRLLYTGLQKKDAKLIDAGIELLLPSISMLANFAILIFVINSLTCLIWPKIYSFFVWSLFLNICIILYFLFGMIVNKSSIETYFALAKAPFFLMWKIGTTLNGIKNFKNKKWVKTQRHDGIYSRRK